MKKLTVALFVALVVAFNVASAEESAPLTIPTPFALEPEVVYSANAGTQKSLLIYDEKVVPAANGADGYVVIVGGKGVTGTFSGVTVTVDVPAIVTGYSVSTLDPVEDTTVGHTAFKFGIKTEDSISLKSSNKAVSVQSSQLSSDKIKYTLAIDKAALSAPKNPSDFIEVDLTISVPSTFKYQLTEDNKISTGAIFEGGAKTTLYIKFFDSNLILSDLTVLGHGIAFDAHKETVYGKNLVEGKNYYVSVDGKKFTKFTAIIGTGTDEDGNGIHYLSPGFSLGKLLDSKKVNGFYISLNPNAGKKNQPKEYVVTCNTILAIFSDNYNYRYTSTNAPCYAGNTTATVDTYEYMPLSPRPKFDKSVKIGYGFDEDNPTVNSLDSTPELPKWSLVGGDDFELSYYEWAELPANKTDRVPYYRFVFVRSDSSSEVRVMDYQSKMILSENNPNPESKSYYVRSVARINGAHGKEVLTLASVPKKVTPAKQKAAPKLKVDYKKEIVKFKAGQMYYVPETGVSSSQALANSADIANYTLMEKNSDKTSLFKTGVSATAAITESGQKVFAYTNATAKAPPSAIGSVATLDRANTPASNVFDTSKDGAIKLHKGFEVFDEAKQKWGGFKKGTESGQVRVKATKEKASSVPATFTITVTLGDKEAKTKDKYSASIS